MSTYSRFVRTTPQLLKALREGAVLTHEEQRTPGSNRIASDFVMREKDGRPICIVGGVVSRSIHAGRIASISGSNPLRYEIRSISK